MTQKIRQTALVILASLGMAVLAAAGVLQQKRGDARLEVEALHSELELALAMLSVRMASVASALERAGALSPDRFAEAYADASGFGRQVPERAMALMPRMPSPDAVSEAVARLGPLYAASDYPEFRLFPPGAPGPHFPVLFVEPRESRQSVFGYDMSASPERLIAAREALDKGWMTTSAPVALSQDDNPALASFLLLFPVYFTEADPAIGATRALLGAGMTPAALLIDHLTLFERHVIRLEIRIADVPLPLTLADDGLRDAPSLPLLRNMTLPDIRTTGFAVPFRASAFYVPSLADGALPFLAAALTALIGTLLVNASRARAASRQALEAALKRKEAELHDIYRIQSRAQRVEALGRLVGGVAHDFNNILSVILGNLDLMREEARSGDLDPLLDEAVAATQRGAHLTRQLLTVGRKSHLRARPLDVAQVLHDSAAMLARVLPESIEMTTVPAAGLWSIEADPDGLQNAILNLALNARDAMDGRGKLIIEAGNIRATTDYLDDRPEEELAPGRYVAISVTDSGAGMSPEIVDRAFEPFFTTKHATDGSGLGLASVLGFCRQSGGTARIYSERGVGTTVRMFLPVSATRAVRDDDLTGSEPDAPRAGRILLAEDEDSVARVIVRQLEAAGYTVRRVSSGDAGLSVLEAGHRFDLLITDLVMPGKVQGAELARRAETIWPRMALLLISGYPQEAAIEGNGVATRHPVLTKPVPRTELLKMLDRLIKT